MPRLRDTILALNSRYVPDAVGEVYPYGVTQHALQMASLLERHGARVGFVLYARHSDGPPQLHTHSVLQRFPAVTVSYDPTADQLVQSALEQAVGRIRQAWSAATVDRPILYLQTPVLLPLAPPDTDVLITHHSPFVADVRAALGDQAARRAFDWDHPKTDHLAGLQERALDALRERSDVRCAEISIIQERFLRAAQVPATRVHRLPPPVAATDAPPRTVAAPLSRVVALASDARVAVTAVSRLDHFKNVELFVHGCVLALQGNAIDHAVVVGGLDADPERARLRALVPATLSERFTMLPRQRRDLVAGWLFPALAGRGIFVCTSRFDLVPYTALEAARAGLATLVPDTGRVGAAEYLSPSYLFRPEPTQLCAAIDRTINSASVANGFAPTAGAVAAGTDDEAVAAAYETICARF